uniref:Non structural virulence protein n=1 Tax=Apapanepox virus TaxID=3049969 RepID=A0AAT9UPI4_9POXV
MLSMKVLDIKKEYSFTRYLDEKFLDKAYIKKNSQLLDKLNRFGCLKDIEIVKYDADSRYNTICLKKYNIVVIILNLPYRSDIVNVKVSKCNKYIRNAKLSINSYLVIRSNTDFFIHISCKAGDNVRRCLKFLDGLDEKITLLMCYYYRDDPIKCMSFSNRFVLIGNYITKWYITRKKTKILHGCVNRITRNTVTYDYYLDSNNVNIMSDTIIKVKDYNITVSLMFTTMKSIKKDNCLLQALRWPLGKPSLTFFKLWYMTEGALNYNRNIRYIQRLIQNIVGRKITKDFQLGDALVAAFGVVRKQANKLGVECKRISFNNLWKDISLIQIVRYNKLVNKRKKKEQKNIVDNTELDYPIIINPWMVDISKEIELCEELKLNILDKVKWSYDWPSLKTVI